MASTRLKEKGLILHHKRGTLLQTSDSHMSHTFSLTTFEHILACIPKSHLHTPPKRTTLIVATLSFLPMPNCADFNSGISKTISSSRKRKVLVRELIYSPPFYTSHTQYLNPDPHIPDPYPAKNVLCNFIFYIPWWK